MSQSRSKLIPGEPLIYERANGVTYARYRDPPHNKIPKWIIGGDPDQVDKAQGTLWSYADWQDMMALAETNNTLKKQMIKLVQTFYLIKEEQK